MNGERTSSNPNPDATRYLFAEPSFLLLCKISKPDYSSKRTKCKSIPLLAFKAPTSNSIKRAGQKPTYQHRSSTFLILPSPLYLTSTGYKSRQLPPKTLYANISTSEFSISTQSTKPKIQPFVQHDSPLLCEPRKVTTRLKQKIKKNRTKQLYIALLLYDETSFLSRQYLTTSTFPKIPSADPFWLLG